MLFGLFVLDLTDFLESAFDWDLVDFLDDFAVFSLIISFIIAY